jgi:hypothetical protein
MKYDQKNLHAMGMAGHLCMVLPTGAGAPAITICSSTASRLAEHRRCDVRLLAGMGYLGDNNVLDRKMDLAISPVFLLAARIDHGGYRQDLRFVHRCIISLIPAAAPSIAPDCFMTLSMGISSLRNRERQCLHARGDEFKPLPSRIGEHLRRSVQSALCFSVAHRVREARVAQ